MSVFLPSVINIFTSNVHMPTQKMLDSNNVWKYDRKRRGRAWHRPMACTSRTIWARWRRTTDGPRWSCSKMSKPNLSKFKPVERRWRFCGTSWRICARPRRKSWRNWPSWTGSKQSWKVNWRGRWRSGIKRRRKRWRRRVNWSGRPKSGVRWMWRTSTRSDCSRKCMKNSPRRCMGTRMLTPRLCATKWRPLRLDFDSCTGKSFFVFLINYWVENRLSKKLRKKKKKKNFKQAGHLEYPNLYQQISRVA